VRWLKKAAVLLALASLLYFGQGPLGFTALSVTTRVNPGSSGTADALVTLYIRAPWTSQQPELSIPQLVQRVKPAVVRIVTPSGSASGFIFQEGGLILTNRHVVEPYSSVKVVVGDSLTLHGRVLGADPSLDLALVQSEVPPGITLIPLGHSSSLQVGQEVLSIGYPLGHVLQGESAVTRGIFSAHREINGRPYLQTDNPTNTGNSGGPVVDLKGYAVGVTAAKIEELDGKTVEGISLAIPADQVREAVEAILARHQAQPAGP